MFFLFADLSSPSASGGEEKESKSSTDVSYQGVTNDIAIEALCKEVYTFVTTLKLCLLVFKLCHLILLTLIEYTS